MSCLGSEFGRRSAGGFSGCSKPGPDHSGLLPGANRVKPGQQGRIESTKETIKRIRESTAMIVGADIAVNKEEMGPPVGAPILLRCPRRFPRGWRACASFQREPEGIEGATELSSDYRVGRPEMRLRIDRAAAKLVGVSTSVVGNTVRTAVSGAIASTSGRRGRT